MAPRHPSKRPRSQTEDGESVEAHSASLRKDSGKRARLSPASDDEDSDTAMSYVSEHVQLSKETNNGPVEDWETVRDGNFEDLQYQEVDDQHSTQIIKKRFENAKRRLDGGKINDPADIAVIEEVKCQNFMCHERLTVKLGPLINFVIGHNGSGKSAVLTAITLCLGGKATATNRGQSLKSFIKEGQEAAILSVRLKNQGSAAYKPEIYGKSIIVERHFSKTGSNNYKIKNANEKTVTTKKADLDDILDAFSLQLDNPMNVLTQDMARQFLNHSGPKEKYKFFLKGTQLEALDHDYRLLSDGIEMIESKYEILEETIALHKKALDEASAKKRQADALDGLHEKIRALRRKLAWSQVAEQEERLAVLDKGIETIDETIAKRRGESDEASRTYDVADQAYNEANASLGILKDSLPPVEERRTAAKEDYDAKLEEGNEIMRQQRDMHQELEILQKSIDLYTTKIHEERHRQEQANGGQHAQKLAEIQEGKVKVAQAKQFLESHRETYTTVTQNLEQANRGLKALTPAILQKRDQIGKSQTLIRNIESDQGRWSAGYDPNLPALLRAIESERRFKDAPVGPMGRHVSLLKPEWSSILERQAGASLNSFVVTSKADENILSELMRRTKCVSGIVIGNSRRLDTSNNEPSRDLDTWMRVLKIDNDLVRNQLIIGHAIDQTVLIPDRRTANDFMTASVRPQNVKQVFAMSEQKRGAGHTFQLTPGGGTKITPIHAWVGRVRMQTDQESQLRFEKETLGQLQQDLRNIQIDEKTCQKKISECKTAVDRHRSTERDLKVRLQRAEESVDKLSQELQEETPQIENLKKYEELVAGKEGEKEVQEASLNDAREARARWEPTKAAAKQLLRSLDLEVKEVEARIVKASRKIQTLREQRGSALLQKNLAIETLKSAEEDREGFVTERQAQQDTVDEYIQGATSVSLRVPIERGETYDSLMKKYDKLKDDMANREAQLGGSKEELAQAEFEANAAHEDAKRTGKSSYDLVSALKVALMDRRDRWSKFRRWIQSGARITFTYLLSERSFRGHLEISSEHRYLDIKVEPDITKNDEGGRQTKTLSGGEKSFSTICLLLALWDAMGSPIRCLDEFDVFMDSVNRDISMKMMIEAARRSVGRQFILITPQAMGSVHIQEDVRIIKMTDPVRGQTTLPFTG